MCKVCGREFVERLLTQAINRPEPNLLLVGEAEKLPKTGVCGEAGAEKGERMQAQESLKTASLLSEFPEALRGKIVEFIAHREVNNYNSGNTNKIVRTLKLIQKAGGDLRDSESVKAAIKQMKIEDSSKKTYADQYEMFLEFMGGKWEKPRYNVEQKQYFIPREEELDQLIAGLGRKTATFCQVAKETGASKSEILWLKWTDIDFEQNIIRINKTTKRHATRSLKVSPKCINMISKLPRTKECIFSRYVESAYYTQRKRIAFKLGNPRLLDIGLHTFRHWVGTMEFHKTHSIPEVAHKLGHKDWKNTQIYVNLEEAYFGQLPEDFVIEVTSDREKIKQLMQNRFEPTLTYNGEVYLRKRK